MNSFLLDNSKTYITPEGTYLQLPLASVVTRARAWFVDFIIRVLLFLFVRYLTAPFGRLGDGIFLISIFLIEWLYPILFEMFYQGQTPGKKLMRIAVMHDDGSPISWRGSIIRNTLRFVDAFPFYYIPGILSMMLNSEFKRMGDLVAGTVVIYLPITTKIKKIDQEIRYAKLTPIAPDVELTPNEEDCIIRFWHARLVLSPMRANQIAEQAVALIGSRKGHDATQYLYQIAIYLIQKNR